MPTKKRMDIAPHAPDHGFQPQEQHTKIKTKEKDGYTNMVCVGENRHILYIHIYKYTSTYVIYSGRTSKGREYLYM